MVQKRRTYHLQGQLKLPDLLPGALKIAYLVAFSSFGDEFLDDPLNSQWQGVIRAKTMAELVIAYIALGAGRSFAFFPFMEPSIKYCLTFQRQNIGQSFTILPARASMQQSN